MKRYLEGPLRVLIVSATVGAGDAGNARELARRLADNGHRPAIRDFLEAAPLGAGRALSKGYEAELRHAPWAYELAFRVWFWFPFLLRPLSRLLSLFTRRTVARWVQETGADVVVSTYPVATQVLGDMRRRAQRRRPWPGRATLDVPAVNFITDFGYHPFWAHRGIDLNLAVHPGTVAAVARRTGRPSMACAPLVSPLFGAARGRRGAIFWPATPCRARAASTPPTPLKSSSTRRPRLSARSSTTSCNRPTFLSSAASRC